MGAYIFRRIIQSLIIVLLVTMIVFSVIRYLPGDPILLYISQDEFTVATPEQILEFPGAV